MKVRSQKGFTLIELLVVISIIGLLSTVVLAALGTTRDKAKNAKIQQELLQMKNTFEIIRNPNGTYPFTALTFFGSHVITLTSINNDVTNIYNDLISTNGGQVVKSFADAKNPTKYSIYSALMPSGTTYWCVDSEGNHTTGPSSSLSNNTLIDGGYCR